MNIYSIEEYGHKQAFLGLGLSFGQTSDIFSVEFLKFDRYKEMYELAKKLAFKTGGENKFLRQISVWLDIEAPIYWWKECDTYKVGTTAQSSSTMHTLTKRSLTVDDFELDDSLKDDFSCSTLIKLNAMISKYQIMTDLDKKKKVWVQLIQTLPSSFLQRRMVSLNYAVLQNMLAFRRNHKLGEWRYFCDYILNNVSYPEFLVKDR